MQARLSDGEGESVNPYRFHGAVYTTVSALSTARDEDRCFDPTRGNTYPMNVLVSHRPLEAAQAGQAKSVLRGQALYLADLVDVQVTSERETFVPVLQRQDHRLRHASVSRARREAEVEAEVHLSGHLDYTAFEDEDVVTRLGHGDRHVAWPGYVAHDGAALEVLGAHDGVDRAGYRHHDIGPRQALAQIRADGSRHAICRAQFGGEFFEAHPVAAHELHVPALGSQDPGARLSYASRSPQHSDAAFLEVLAEQVGGVLDSLQGRGHRVAVAGRHGNAEGPGHGDARIADHRSKRPQTEERRA